MKISVIYLLLIFILNVDLQAANIPVYKLVLFENDNYRDWTYIELKNKITKDNTLVDLNKCNGKENQFLPELVKSNSNRNSLRIQSSTDQSLIIYIDGQIFNTNMALVNVNSIKDKYTKEIIINLSSLRSTAIGKSLLSHLQKSLYPLTIVQLGGPRFEAISDNGKNYSGYDEASAIQHFVTLRRSDEVGLVFNKVGAGGKIHFDPFKTYSNIESDMVSRTVPPVITLGHELFHAYDSIRGLLDRRFVNGVKTEFIEVCEYRATYFENLLRKSIGKKYRKVYGSLDGEKSLLDNNNEPYLLPSPCIK